MKKEKKAASDLLSPGTGFWIEQKQFCFLKNLKINCGNEVSKKKKKELTIIFLKIQSRAQTWRLKPWPWRLKELYFTDEDTGAQTGERCVWSKVAKLICAI